jgi:hypothetical protein
MMNADLVLSYTVTLLSATLPISVIVVASWRVAKLSRLTMDSYQDRVDDSVAETLKEMIGERLLAPLYNTDFPPGRTAYDIVDILVPGSEIELLTSMYTNLAQLGIHSESYLQLLEVINSFW